MSINITNNGMPNNSHCIEEIELHTGTCKCVSEEYYTVENVSYPIVVNCNDTSNIVSFDYDHITFDDNCNETHHKGVDSVEIVFPENDTYRKDDEHHYTKDDR